MRRLLLGLLLVAPSLALGATGVCNTYTVGSGYADALEARSACSDWIFETYGITTSCSDNSSSMRIAVTYWHAIVAGETSYAVEMDSTCDDYDGSGHSHNKQIYRWDYGESVSDCPRSSNDPDGSVWDSQLEACVCPAGTTSFFGTDGSYSCVPELPECTPSEPTFMGYLNDQPVCSYDGHCGEGEQGGLVDGEWVCLPDACDGGTYINGACITPDDTTNQPQTEHNEPDSDGDGTPDSQDDDIDGDGTPNSQDDDIDGDGVLNPDDQSNEDKGSATAQGGCDQPPSCTGDAQECALLKQQWYAMCYTEDYQSDSGGFYDPDSSDDIESRIDVALQDFKSRVEGSAVVTGIDGFFSLAGGGSCPSYSVSAWVFDITLDQWCSPEIPWGMISGLLFAVALLIAARIAVS